MSLLAALALPAFAAPQSRTPPLGEQLTTLYHQVSSSFWRGEHGMSSRSEHLEWHASFAAPLPPDVPLRTEYSRAAQAGDEWLKLADENHIQNWMSDTVIYLDALSHYTLGNYPRAIELFNRLSHDYLRYQYLGEGHSHDPNFADPGWPGISKLLLYARLKTLSNKPANAFAALKQITADALTTLAAQRDFAALIASHSTRYNTYEFREEFFGGERYGEQPDQYRAAALPRTLSLVEEAWDKLLPAAVKADAKGVRAWLRGLSAPEAPLSKVALDRLQGIDNLIIREYFASAQQAMNAHNYDGARAKYRQVIAEYPNTDAAQKANDALPKIVPIAVNFYKQSGDQNYRAADPDQFMKPQTKSREFYEKAYKEDMDGPQSAQMLYDWAKALATEKGHVPDAIRLMEQWMNKYPKEHPLRVQAMWQLAFFYATQGSRYADGIKLMDQIVKEYPHSPEAAESLWHAAMLWTGLTDGGKEGYEKGLPYLERYYKEYPNAPRWPNGLKWINRFKEKINAQ